MGTKKSDKISAANICAVIGLMAMGFLSWYGYQLDGNTPGTSLLIAVGLTIIAGAALVLAIKAKMTEEHLRKWRAFEVLSVVVLVAILAVNFLPCTYAINFIVNKSDLTVAATRDCDNAKALLADFSTKETERLEATVGGLENLKNSGVTTLDTPLYNYMMNQFSTISILGENDTRISDFRNKYVHYIENISIDGSLNRAGFDNAIEMFAVKAYDCNPYEMREMSTDIMLRVNEISTRLTATSSALNLPQIISAGTFYKLVETEPNTYNIETLELPSKFTSIFRVEWTATIVVFIYLLLLSNYLLAYRSTKLKLNEVKASDKYGRVL